MRTMILTAASTLLLSASIQLRAADYIFDTVHTQIIFSVSHQGFSNSRGTFTDFDGSFTYDADNPEKSKVEVVIETDSLDFNDDEWNSHIMGENWFNVDEYPTMTFKSTRVTALEGNALQIDGTLTMLGETAPVTLNTMVNKVGQQFGKPKAGFSASTTIDRTQWGMSSYVPFIGADIRIELEVEGFEVTE